MLINVKEINFKKYRRVFAFGCSFTAYMWPTWADVLASESPNARFINVGQSGAGNLMITAKLAETDARFKFNKDDLIMIMWTTYCREDRYLNNNWVTPGNIYTQNTYDDDYVKKWADTKGYMIRDLGIMSVVLGFLKNIDSDAFTLISVPSDYQQDMDDPSVSRVLDLYKETIEASPTSMLELGLNNNFTSGHHYYGNSITPDLYFGDYHPNTKQYRRYLELLRIPLTELSREFTEKSMISLLGENTLSGILKQFDDMIKERIVTGTL